MRRDPSDVVRRDLETRLMDESRQSSLRGAGTALRRATPPPALCGFLLLLALIFTVSYAAGTSAGPVAPGMHNTDANTDAYTGDGSGTGESGTGGTGGSGTGGAGDTGGSGDMDGMDGMEDMQDMDMGGGGN
ncbi:hypothetical protein [Streptomyces geranii]|uniref:hypothetical protein n=1 Tax=Streptomyces geranii TaxID=2058923 RepID=UPI001E4E04A9|nr:hypothetical protein [Streptomyces geranii]